MKGLRVDLELYSGFLSLPDSHYFTCLLPTSASMYIYLACQVVGIPSLTTTSMTILLANYSNYDRE